MPRDYAREGFEPMSFTLTPIPERGSMRFVLRNTNQPTPQSVEADFVLPRSAWERFAARLGVLLADDSW